MAKISSKSLLILGIILMVFLFFYVFPNNMNVLRSYESANPTQVILLWTPFFGQDDYYFGFGRQPFLDNECPVYDCEVTNNRSRLNESHAVVFHSRNLDAKDLPKIRNPEQYWIFFSLESPVHTSALDILRFRNFFNWTMTYRFDSDVFAPYGCFSERKFLPESVTNFNQRNLAVWLVSNCKTESRRENYVAHLSRYIDIDRFGGCSGRACDAECEMALYSRYKFFLAFENSFCRDYVTEKFFKTLQHQIVPVVYGFANYSKLAPPNSFVDAREFDTPKELADFLMLLNANYSAYVRYLDWKTDYVVDDRANMYFCRLCAKLHQRKHPRIYQDLYRWWFNGAEKSNKPICNYKF